jgi:hypothetical protein
MVEWHNTTEHQANTTNNMNMSRLMPLCILLTALLPSVGCRTHTPMVRYHDGTYQVKVEAAAHWHQMADELRKQISAEPGLRGCSAIFIQPLSRDGSDFDLAYHRMIKVQLLSQGWKVVDQPDAPPARLPRYPTGAPWRPKVGECQPRFRILKRRGLRILGDLPGLGKRHYFLFCVRLRLGPFFHWGRDRV